MEERGRGRGGRGEGGVATRRCVTGMVVLYVAGDARRREGSRGGKGKTRNKPPKNKLKRKVLAVAIHPFRCFACGCTVTVVCILFIYISHGVSRVFGFAAV